MFLENWLFFVLENFLHPISIDIMLVTPRNLFDIPKFTNNWAYLKLLILEETFRRQALCLDDLTLYKFSLLEKTVSDFHESF